ncbi:MAG: UDP-N-acetyl-D-glucosamine 6-dehydrogenase [Chloroflexi bacterium ADurb.Bin120]|jgi:UDP-N-acetyl-D-glucosamine dehydrogenase|uniref:UDP-N-acetyl-D-glucosamine 6-dehydrogenase n=1 Tax=Candidatus Brevifilum fermentans TaxID=1986204 RepID=A0A1Y6K0S2_9CHLR|nr:nucleotide sugar dehydrogenase [Brevefilum fermentans]OQB87031.1 MAG: UDP-N-acetyl-D-glucosamine 6-dehydrogenase [Chloroflexi bacterium ADurb.Bin120]SMX53282.1 UDP-N-acetyl-D-glucosamine 6-dehydrogenase [Brevefilum fermentans]HOM66864.1 nucleotide sugar dehydrogenase [Brevefilum fermentans]
MGTIKENLIQKFRDRSARVGVVGIGYVGLPLAVVFAEAGFTVVGVDPDVEKVETINRGESYILDVSSERVKALVDAGLLSASNDYAILSQVDAVSICVPTPLRKTGDPDLSFIVSASRSLAPHMHQGMAVVLESSTYPGTTREMILPAIESTSGLSVCEDFFLAFSPERVDPGRDDWTTINTPKVIGGISPDCTEVATAWYSQALETIVPVSTCEVAEMTKLLENTFRMINIGMVNELAIMCDRLKIDVWEVIDAAATKPFGFMKFTPGPGLGGHCIPVDPLYLSWKLRSLNYTARFIELASEINTSMPRYTLGKIQDALNLHKKPINGSQVLILGAAYKPNVDDLRESPALDVIHLLQEKGADVIYHDPYIPHLEEEGLSLSSVPDLMQAVEHADCVAIITNHAQYDYGAILARAKLIVDTRNALGNQGKDHPKVVRL